MNGATSWYGIGGMTLQPSEFAKAATSLAVAKYISDLNTNINTLKDQISTFVIIVIPAFLILLQNDAGSTVVYASFFFVLYREGLPKYYLTIGVSLVLIAVCSLKFGSLITSVIAAIFVFGFYFKTRKKTSFLKSIFYFNYSNCHIIWNKIILR